MKRLFIYACIAVISYISGIFSYKTAQSLLAIPDKSEIDLK